MSLKPIGLIDLLSEPDAETIVGGLKLVPTLNWVVEGEDRLSYTTLTRLIECCREHHWKEDVEKIVGKSELDSITKSVSANYFHPVLTGKKILIKYQIKEVREKGYMSEFIITDEEQSVVYAEYSVVFIFYSSIANKVIKAPKEVLDNLTNLMSHGN